MFVVENYPTAVLFCIVTMLCWGSWANTQKAVGQRWRFELFYWDYVFGVVLAARKASFAISYGLGQGATMVAAFWGVFIWREFRDAPRGTTLLLSLMFVGYLVGLALVIVSRVV